MGWVTLRTWSMQQLLFLLAQDGLSELDLYRLPRV